MKIMSREFTLGERLLLMFLALILVGLCYYYFVDIPVRSTLTSTNAEITSLKKELSDVEARLTYLKDIRKNLDDLEDTGMTGWMGSYNNSKAEVRFLNDVLANTLKYSISFSNVTRSGNQIRRNFSLQFQTVDYQAAQEIMTRLMEGDNRCLVGDMNCSIGNNGAVSLTATATFYETMVGGVADAGLPESK